MDFDIDNSLHIFDTFFDKRLELNKEEFKKDLERYYLPFAKSLIKIKDHKQTLDGVIVGVSAIQGAGKTTQGEIMEILLSHLGHSTISLSIDDHYITHSELCKLRETDSRYIRRGVTHDIPLAILNLRDLRNMRDEPIIISGYDKGANHGDGERFRWINPIAGCEVTLKVVKESLVIDKQDQEVLAMKLVSLKYEEQEISLPDRMGSDIPVTDDLLPSDLVNFLEKCEDKEVKIYLSNEKVIFLADNSIEVLPTNLPHGWRIITQKPSFIFYDGWMLAARRVEDESVFSSGLPALETADDIAFAKMINQKLELYEPLWEMFEYLNLLYVPDYQISIQWRDQAETHLREKGQGMTEQEIIDFVHYFWRSVHPAIQIENLAKDKTHTNQVVIINNDHSIKEITPLKVSLI